MYLRPVDKEIIKLTADGMSLKEISTITKMSMPTITAYRTRIIKIFGAKNSANLVALAYNHGLLNIPTGWVKELIITP